MLTFSYANEPTDEIAAEAMLTEWALRENAYRKAFPDVVAETEAVMTLPPARDAGDVCTVCGELVTWVDHLPPLAAGWPVRCMKNVRHI